MRDERQKIYKILLVCAESFGKQISEASLKLYVEALGDVSATQVERAVVEHMRSPQGRFYPSPGDLLSHIRPTLSPVAAANECVIRTMAAIAKFGYVDPGGAEIYLGPVIWAALPGRSGYLELCTGERMNGTVRAQLRDRIATKLILEFGGNVQLPQTGKPEQQAFVPWPEDEPDRHSQLVHQLQLVEEGQS